MASTEVIWAELAAYWEEACLTERQLRKYAERDRDYWHEIADHMSSIVDKYAQEKEEGPF